MDNLNINPGETPINRPVAPPVSYQQNVKPSNRNWLKVLVGSLLILLMTATAFAAFTIYNQSSVEITDQPLQKTITVKKLVLKKPGFLGIHTANRYGKPGSNISSTEYLLPDTYTDFTIDLSQNFLDSASTADQVMANKLLFATIYEDSDGSKVLSNGDKPMRDFLGRPISVKFRLR